MSQKDEPFFNCLNDKPVQLRFGNGIHVLMSVLLDEPLTACFTASAATATYPCAYPAPGVPAFPVRSGTVEPMPSQDMLWSVIKLEGMAIEIFVSYKSGLVLPML